MSVPSEVAERERERFKRSIERLRASPEEVARNVAESPSFDYDAWLREAGPAVPEELAEMEEFLQERDAERRTSIAAEGGE